LIAADLSRCRLYGILDLAYVADADAARIAEEMIDGGVDLIQLRAKERALNEISDIAMELNRIARKRTVPLVINDYPEIARSVAAAGVHVGQDDVSIQSAREIVGPESMVGKSTHSIDQAMRAFHEGADYIGFGPLFATPTKPDYTPIGLRQIGAVHEAVRIPIFCIGGIKLENLPDVISAGAKRVVIVSGLLRAADVASYARSAKQFLSKTKI
jgi:thiamine-phosphate pyrophosphorylase